MPISVKDSIRALAGCQVAQATQRYLPILLMAKEPIVQYFLEIIALNCERVLIIIYGTKLVIFGHNSILITIFVADILKT